MAPIPTREDVVMQPSSNLVCSKAAKFETQPSIAIGNSRIKRCSSVSSEEEVRFGGTDRSSFLSFAMSIKKTSMFTICDSATGTLNTAWPGVICGLEEDERPAKGKEKMPVEPEEKKLAVENDDNSSNCPTTTESSLFEFKLDEKYFNFCTGTKVLSKSEKCGKCFLV